MSIEHDQSTRKAMRAGISGENVLRPLDEFSVTVKRGEHTEIRSWESYWVSCQAFNSATWTKLKNKQ